MVRRERTPLAKRDKKEKDKDSKKTELSKHKPEVIKYEQEQIDPNDEDAILEQEARQILAEHVENAVAERMNPIVAGQREEKRNADLQALEKQYPELRTSEGAAPVLAKAQEVAESLGSPEMAYEAPFLRQVYLAMKAEAASTAERESEAEAEMPLESPSGGNRKAAEDEDAELADRIVAAGQNRNSFLLGS